MMPLDEIKKNLLREVSDLHGVPAGAYNIRENGETAARVSTENIEILPRESGDGIRIDIRPGTKNESVHIPVIISKAGLTEAVYNDFYVGEDADVTLVAGCFNASVNFADPPISIAVSTPSTWGAALTSATWKSITATATVRAAV